MHLIAKGEYRQAVGRVCDLVQYLFVVLLAVGCGGGTRYGRLSSAEALMAARRAGASGLGVADRPTNYFLAKTLTVASNGRGMAATPVLLWPEDSFTRRCTCAGRDRHWFLYG